MSSSTTLALEFRFQKLGCLIRIRTITKMRGQHGGSQVAIAHRITDSTAAEDQKLVPRKVWDLAIVGTPLCIAEGDSRGNFVLDDSFYVFDSTVDNGGALAVRN